MAHDLPPMPDSTGVSSDLVLVSLLYCNSLEIKFSLSIDCSAISAWVTPSLMMEVDGTVLWNPKSQGRQPFGLQGTLVLCDSFIGFLFQFIVPIDSLSWYSLLG
jgi:hypothetical protein